jgi:hypothetical protein
MPDVTLLHFDGCPSWRLASQRLEALADEYDLRITHQAVETPEDAERWRFLGSPSILVDGQDLFARGDELVGLTCRVYQTADGPAGSPTTQELRAALSDRQRRQGS